jgi:hypothetical protein
MAKRPATRSTANDPAAAPAAPKPKRTRAAARSAAQDTAADRPSVDDIRRRAYERYLERGGNHGRHFDDWLEAEKELTQKVRSKK